MKSPLETLEELVRSAVIRAFEEVPNGFDAAMRQSEFADAQSNCALALARAMRQSPKSIAQRIADELPAVGLDEVGEVEVSGPGYLNFTFAEDWLVDQLARLHADPRLGVPLLRPETIPVDYSAPNVAKEMHVGHLRTTVVGDCLVRVLEALGHRVVRQNHIGDWGTPFGMLIEHLADMPLHSDAALLLVSDPNAFYQNARHRFDTDPSFAARARKRVVLLQANEPVTIGIWQEIVARSKQYFNLVYDRLGITLSDEDIMGESAYNDELAEICAELESAGIARESNGALCVFLPGRAGRDGQPSPLIIRKSDGGYGYATTDLATVRHRVRDLNADRLIYVIGATQSQHLEMVWETARLAGWLPERVETVHVRIGNVLGADHKILRTRTGDSVRLLSFLDEAIDQARRQLASRSGQGNSAEDQVAEQVGIAAVKYAELSVAHDTDYVFDAERMVATNGNTGPYLQYAAVRIQSIFRNLGVDASPRRSIPLKITNGAEHNLVLDLLRFGTTVASVGASYEPHVLCAYLFHLAQNYSRVYEVSPIAGTDIEIQQSRILLSRITLSVLTEGMGLLGISVPEQL